MAIFEQHGVAEVVTDADASIKQNNKAPSTDEVESQTGREKGLRSGPSDEDLLLISLGKNPELKRTHNFWTLCAYQVMMCCSWSCNVVLYSTIFDIGGPLAFIWGTIIVAIMQTLLMASLAEFAGIWPTAGGQQFWTQVLATPKTRGLLSYIVGWAVLVGEISTGSSCAINSAQIIAAFVQITHPDISWAPWMTWVIYSVFLVGPIISNLAPRYLPALNAFGAFWTIGGGLAWAIVFLVMAPKSSAKFVFTTWINNSGWPNGWCFIMSFYTPIYGLYGTDGSMHLLEEMKDASKNAPRMMIWSMVFCGITSWISAVIMMYTAGDFVTYLTYDQAYLNWFMDVTGSIIGGGVFCALLMMGLNYFIIVGTNTAGSRLAWAMARDKAFPFSDYFAHVSTRFGIPLRTMIAILVIDLVIGLIVLGSDLAFQAIISGGGVTLQIGYLVPVLLVCCSGRKVLPPRPYFDLGRFGWIVNYLSVCWSLICIMFFSFPFYYPVTLPYMNWSCLIVGATIIFPGAWWIFRARHVYIKNVNSVLDDNVVLGPGDKPIEGAIVAMHETRRRL